MLLLLAGLFIGVLSAALGVGGGILTVPTLMALMSDLSHPEVAATSLGVMVLSSLTGSFAYSRQGLINYRIVLYCALMAIPGTSLGVFLTNYISRDLFSMVFGILLLIYSPLLYFKKRNQESLEREVAPKNIYMLAGGASFLIGTLASLLAIGGGILYVPLLLTVGLPVRQAVASSLGVITLTSIVGSAQHIYYGNLKLTESYVWMVGLGMFIGGFMGSKISMRLPKQLLVKVMSMLLLIVGLKLILN